MIIFSVDAAEAVDLVCFELCACGLLLTVSSTSPHSWTRPTSSHMGIYIRRYTDSSFLRVWRSAQGATTAWYWERYIFPPTILIAPSSLICLTLPLQSWLSPDVTHYLRSTTIHVPNTDSLVCFQLHRCAASKLQSVRWNHRLFIFIGECIQSAPAEGYLHFLKCSCIISQVYRCPCGWYTQPQQF